MKAVAAATRVATAPFARRDTFKGPVSRGPSSPVVGPVASVKTSRTGNMAKKTKRRRSDVEFGNDELKG